MKAAILKQLGTIPVYGDFPDPVIENENQQLLYVKAASIKNIDRMRVAGKHYINYNQFPCTIGLDGVGTLEDGTRVYATGINGIIAEKALIHKNQYTIVPGDVDDATAAALPNAVIGAAMALQKKGKIKKGDVVLINGATGVTGKLAVQLAKYYGAGKVIATGRNTAALNQLKTLGADVVLSLNEEQSLIEQLTILHKEHPFDLVIDYLWGKPVEIILGVLARAKQNDAHIIKIVTVGEMAGSTIQLASGVLRSRAIEIMGSGLGSLSNDDLKAFFKNILPEVFQLYAEGKLQMDIETALLKDVEMAWQQDVPAGKRLVILI